MDRPVGQSSGCMLYIKAPISGGLTVFSNPQYLEIVLHLFLLVVDSLKQIQIVFTSDLNHQRILKVCVKEITSMTSIKRRFIL